MPTIQPYSATAQVKSLAGTAALPGITFTGDTDTGFYSPAANQVAITTGGVQRLLIGSDGSITPSGSLLFPAGTAAAPSLSFTGDTDTGIYSPSANSVAISTGGSGRLFVDASGNVGVATGAPSYRLEVNGTISQSSQGTSSALIQAVNAGGIFYHGLDNSAGTTFGHAYAAALWHSGAYPILFATNGTERLRITSAGLVGVGTSSPGFPFQVKSTTNAHVAIWDNGGIPQVLGVNDAGGSAQLRLAGQILSFTGSGGAGSEHMRLDASGRLGIGTSSPINSLEVVGGATSNLFAVKASSSGDCLSITARSAGNGAVISALNGAQSDYEPFELNGEFIYFQTRTGTGTVSERLRITSAGLVGIGTSSPASLLSVVKAAEGTSLEALRLVNESPNQRNTSSVYIGMYGSNEAYERARILCGNPTDFDGNNGFLSFWTRNAGTLAEKVRIDNAGRLGIGTTSPARTLDVNGSIQLPSNNALYINGSNNYLYADSTATELASATLIKFVANGSERLRITSAGLVGIGTSTPSERLDLGGGVSDTINIRFTMGGNVATIGSTGSGVANGLGNLTFATRNGSSMATAMTIDGSQRVGIGFTSVEAPLHAGGTTSTPVILAGAISGDASYKFRQSRGTITSPSDTGGEGVRLSFEKYNGPGSAWASPIAEIYAAGGGSGADGYLEFLTKPSGGSATPRARIDSSGRLLVGTSSARANVFNTSVSGGQLQIETAGAGGGEAQFGIYGGASGSAFPGPVFVLGAHKSASVGGNGLLSNGDRVGLITFQGNDGSQFVEAARITSEVDGTPGADDMPGRLVFSTTADGASSPTERLRITSAGFVGIGTSAPSNTLHVNSGAVGTSTLFESTGAGSYLGIKNSSGQWTLGATTTSFILENSGGTALTIDSSRRVGIGTTSPNSALQVNSGTNLGGILVGFNSGSSNFYDADLQVFRTGNGTERARIDSSGRLLVGTSSTSDSAKYLMQGNAVDATGGAIINLCNGKATPVNGEAMGIIRFSDNTHAEATTIMSARDGGTWSGTSKPSRLTFSTTADGASSPTERLRITSAGLVGIGTSSPSGLLHVAGQIYSSGTGYAGTNSPTVRLINSTATTGRTFGINSTDSGSFQVFDASAGDATRLWLDSSGRVGIGTLSPGALLHAAGKIRFGSNAGYYGEIDHDAGSTGANIYDHSDTGGHIFRNGGQEALRIDGSKRLLVGTSTARLYTSLGYARFQVEGTAFADSSIGLTNNQETVDGSYIIFNKTRGTSVGSVTSVQYGDLLGSIWFQGSDGTSQVRGAVIEAVVDAMPGASDMPGRLVFSTTADGASSPTERMRIAANGQMTHSLNGTTNAANLTLNVGGVGDPGNTGWITPRIDFVGSSLASSGTTFIGATGGFGGRSLVFATGSDGAGTERARIDSSGRLLVGTSTGSYKFQINALGSTGFVFDDANGAISNTFGTGGNLTLRAQVVSSSGGGEIYLGGSTRGDSNINSIVLSTANTERMRIDSSGRVGIGTTSPTTTLDCRGVISTNDAIYCYNTARDGLGIWYNPGGAGVNQLTARVAGGDRLTIDSSGNVGIGTTSPSAQLSMGNSVAAQKILVYENLSGGTNSRYGFGIQANEFRQFYPSDSVLTFGTINISDGSTYSERGRWDSSGRLLVGTSSARSNFFNSAGLGPALQLESTSSEGRLASIVFNTNSASGPYLILGKTRATSNGASTLVNNGDEVGALSFQAGDGTDLVEAALIKAEIDGTPGANDMPGRLVFSTTADGASSPTERMRIPSSGGLLINTTSRINDGLNTIGFQGSIQKGLVLNDTDPANTRQFIGFHISGTTQIGYIANSNNTGVTYSTSSDYRLKENVTPVTDGITRLQQLKPSRFNFIADPDTVVDGFIAHEVQDIVPEAITGEKDAVDDEGNPVYQGIDQSKLVPLLTAALQEAIGEIESLKARLTAAGI